MALTYETAKRRYETKFTPKRLLTFDGTGMPCTIFCDTHGEQVVSRYSNLVRSKTGCPKCGEELNLLQRISRLSSRSGLKVHLEDSPKITQSTEDLKITRRGVTRQEDALRQIRGLTLMFGDDYTLRGCSSADVERFVQEVLAVVDGAIDV